MVTIVFMFMSFLWPRYTHSGFYDIHLCMYYFVFLGIEVRTSQFLPIFHPTESFVSFRYFSLFFPTLTTLRVDIINEWPLSSR